jgi:hypothetical protein
MDNKLYRVAIPATFIEDARDGIEDQAREGDQRFTTLLAKIEAAPVNKRGNGFSVTVHLTEDELGALQSEAEYKNEYWNTDSFGIKESKGTIPQYAKSAKRMANRIAKIRESA